MNSKDKKELTKLLEQIAHPSVTGTTYSFGGSEPPKVTQHATLAEVNRLLDSADYKAGWNACAKNVAATILYLMEKSET